MSTTIDDLIAVKDAAVNACYVIANDQSIRFMLKIYDPKALAQVDEAVRFSELYDVAEEDSDVCSIEDYTEVHGEDG